MAAAPTLKSPKVRATVSVKRGLSVCVLAGLVAMSTAVASTSAVAIPRAATAVQNCGSLSVGPGAGRRGATAGARCLLHAYQLQCRSAVYVLSRFGVDTIASDRFRLARESGHCLVTVTVSFRIVPQPARTHTGSCRTLALKSTHVVAGRCTGTGIPSSFVLDPKSQTP